jgi:hypothetical protein
LNLLEAALPNDRGATAAKGIGMTKIAVLTALAMFALGAVVGRASVHAPVASHATPDVFSPTLVVPVNPNMPIESYTAI